MGALEQTKTKILRLRRPPRPPHRAQPQRSTGPRKRAGPSCAQDARIYWYSGQNWRSRLLRKIEILNSTRRFPV